MDAFYRPLDQVQPVSEISNMKQMQWWRDGVVVNPCKSNLGLSATSSTAFASFIWKARDLEKHRLSRFKEMWVNVQKSCGIQKWWWSLHTRNGLKDGIFANFLWFGSWAWLPFLVSLQPSTNLWTHPDHFAEISFSCLVPIFASTHLLYFPSAASVEYMISKIPW